MKYYDIKLAVVLWLLATTLMVFTAIGLWEAWTFQLYMHMFFLVLVGIGFGVLWVLSVRYILDTVYIMGTMRSIWLRWVWGNDIPTRFANPNHKPKLKPYDWSSEDD
jgi:hypothetical protein